MSIKNEESLYLKLLHDALKDIADSQKWLERSYLKCRKIRIKETYTEDECDQFEALTSRFGRTTDFLINKIYRAIDRAELEGAGTLIDVVNRMHKRGLIDSVDEIRKLKELRNEIAHDYTNRDIKQIFEDVFFKVPLLLNLIERVQKYCSRFN